MTKAPPYYEHSKEGLRLSLRKFFNRLCFLDRVSL